MSDELRNWRAVSVLVVALMFASCGSGGKNAWVELNPEPAGSGQTVQITGTVVHLDLEGGLFVIRDAEGTSYNPTNLPGDFRVEGMAIEASVRRRDDLASIGMVGPMVDLVRIRMRPGGTASVSGTGRTESLWGTVWILEDLAGAGVIDGVQATLELSEDGRVTGNGSCNQFRGTVTVRGAAITFGPLATTRMACAEAVMHQETRYLEALGDADRFEIEGTLLYIHAGGRPQPLRFTGAR